MSKIHQIHPTSQNLFTLEHNHTNHLKFINFSFALANKNDQGKARVTREILENVDDQKQYNTQKQKFKNIHDAKWEIDHNQPVYIFIIQYNYNYK